MEVKNDDRELSLLAKGIRFYSRCRRADCNFFVLVIRYLYHRIVHGQTLQLHQKVRIKGAGNIAVKGKLEVGTAYNGFTHRKDRTYLNIEGKLNIEGSTYIGRGCRFNIGEDAHVSIGDGGYINCNTKLIIMHHLKIGNNSGLSWDCQVLDEDFHSLSYPGQKESGDEIIIGNNVWIGSGVKIYKGTIIPDGCVVASDSVVKGVYTKERTLLGGIPARVLKEDITWSW